MSQFRIDWEHQQAICPEGHTSSSWTPAIDNRTNEVIKIRFSTTDCRTCPREQHEALQAARRREQTPAFAKLYARREGIEATISQGVRAFDLRRSRYIGFDKTHFQHVSIAAAINVVRIVAWLDGDLPAPTRVSAFQRLCSTA